GLKQTQEDPWQRVVDTYNVGDELAGKVTKVVTFGAFVEILDGVEGLVHISELANHHVENPREVVQPDDEVRVRILEIDSERRRLSLSVKRVEGQVLPLRSPESYGEGAGDLDDVPSLGLSDDVFSAGSLGGSTLVATSQDETTQPGDDAEPAASDEDVAAHEAATEGTRDYDPAPEAEAPDAEAEAPAADTDAPAADAEAPAADAEAPAADAEAPAEDAEAPSAPAEDEQA
ncbi:MAG: small subunit ribosomal protein, partial [Solirubrobacteraceae bacterium]|nr:small subunit ribosomal protein [Solirubrobacteraceae bacterium]